MFNIHVEQTGTLVGDALTTITGRGTKEPTSLYQAYVSHVDTERRRDNLFYTPTSAYVHVYMYPSSSTQFGELLRGNINRGWIDCSRILLSRRILVGVGSVGIVDAWTRVVSRRLCPKRAAFSF